MRRLDFLAIDPGTKRPGSACAYFESGLLVRVCFAFRPSRGDSVEIVVERPQVDARTAEVGARTIVNLAWDGAIAAASAAGDDTPIHAYTVQEWKGNEAKARHHARLWFECITKAERRLLGGAVTEAAIEAAVEKSAKARWKMPGATCYPESFITHNLLDAAALGCFHAGRLEKAAA